MTFPIRPLAFILATGFICSAALADCHVKNEDEKEYSAKVTDSQGMETDTTFGANSDNTLTSGDVTIYVDGVGKITAGTNDTVIIKDGQISKEQ